MRHTPLDNTCTVSAAWNRTRTLNRFLMPYRKILTNGYLQIETLNRLVNQLTTINPRIMPVDEVTLKNALYKAGRILETQESM